ncbi:SusC/RagA family TonB-linked outer membrane protein [Carboxylicivirga taeanensis]|uniref:SusC/RagA family TonB-linked outer membrane protein n=1 Tax=Carboxylicivirga taeanensis TaxID=1416875 RepID=UPI003F6DCCC0
MHRKYKNLIQANQSLKLTRVLLILVLFQVFTGVVYGQNERLSISLSDVHISEVFKTITAQSRYTFAYNDEDIARVTAVSVDLKNATVPQILDQCFVNTGLNYVIKGDVIVVKYNDEAPPARKQPRTITGTVIDENGEPVIGVNIVNTGSFAGTVTDFDGKYEIVIPDGEGVLSFTFIGYKKQEVKIEDDNIIDVQLQPEMNEIDDVVVTGYTIIDKESYTGSAKTISGEELKTVSSQNVLASISVIEPSFKLVDNIDAGSDPNHMPEFNIRGGSSLEGDYLNSPNMPTFILDGFEVTAQVVFDLDPNRVKSITILKDASATAIYGSRAANGVVVVETIAPKTGKLKLNYNMVTDFSIPDLSYFDIMNAEEKLEYERLAGLYESNTNSNINQDKYLDEYNERLKLVKQGVNTDWMSIPLKDVSVSSKHYLFLEGGDNTFRYGVDYSYKDINGVMKGSSNKQVATAVKLQYRFKKVNFKYQLSYNNVNQENSPYGTFSQYSYQNPYYYPYTENGNIKRVLYASEGTASSDVYNPIYNTTLSTKDVNSYNVFTNNLSVNWEILEGLRLKSNLSITQRDATIDKFKPANHTDFIDSSLKGSYYKSVTKSNSFDGNSVLSYFKVLKKHLINSTFIFNITEKRDDNFNITAYNFPNDKMDHISMAIEYADGAKPEGYNYITRLLGFVGNVNYSYDNRFLLDMSVRSDGSSIYGSDKRWGTFGSVGVGWNIHNEKLLAGSKSINLLKLRGSLGTTGSNNFNPYQALTMYTYKDYLISGLPYDGSIGAILKAYGNTDLMWQKTEKLDVGLDYGLMNNRITGSFSVYRNLSKGVLIDVILAPSTGFSSFKDNLGMVKNSGFEWSLRGTMLKNMTNRMQWDLFFSITQNKNELMEINDNLAAYNDVQDSNTSENSIQKPVVRYMKGHSINTIWANESLGIDPNTGEEVFLDMNGQKTNVWSTANYKPLGNRDPKLEGNFGTMFMFKNLTMNAYFRFEYGGDIYNSTLVDKIENVNPRNNADRRVLYGRWQKPGDMALYKAITNTTLTMPTSRFIEQQNFIELSSLNLTYQFELDSFKKVGIDRFKVSAIGNNIFRWSTVKMERGINYPFARNYSLSVQLSF